MTNSSIGFLLGVIGIIACLPPSLGCKRSPQKPTSERQQLSVTETSTGVSKNLEDQPYVDSTKGFEIHVPKGWRVDKSGQWGVPVVFTHTETDEESGSLFTANIVVTYGPAEGFDLDTFVMRTKGLRYQLLGDYKLVEEKDVTIASGQNGRLIGGTYTQGPSQIRNLELIVVHKREAYILPATALESKWNLYKDLLENSLRTFKLPR